LVLAHLAGDPDAFAVIVDDHYPALVSRARFLLGQHGPVEDACQETFRKALEGIWRFGRSGQYRVGAWLSTILRGVCIDLMAKANRDHAISFAMSVEQPVLDDVAEQVADPLQVAALQNALSHLRPSLRRALILREMEGMSYAKLAAAEHISEGCARTRAFRARQLMRQELAS
jgi:RNA polymerase sigma-70 factor (ECF subfamily)